ncbi:pyruvate dehydrogenase complex transcriptional repressor PdhR [Aliidiomarina quisquiliarum]|uniref:pyruvate dehydrogenase complex transcriptional repressor PdhR n=1 Tax=Aliidiomarina quisquiliarum TaxID=2938947 RepID=UPI00208EBB32|nr:pyruvate dehydrogenase complex transcriptional repressor PdhR [Aliidiomarina quisquiliarum]MCO4321484.1 pyruvate dehydrogenase complex transcriptional repressor PdhR [Aliidiomarina quisquiliarum]
MNELSRIQHTKLSDIIVGQIEALIIDGSWAAGERIPSERELAKRFEVSRPSLREAIQKLEALGLVTRRQGGGTFVASALDKQVVDPLFDLLARHPESQFDLLEFRHALESVSAYFAALRGTDTDMARIAESFAAASKKGLTTAQHAHALVAFYVAVAEASHNLVLLHLVRGMNDLLRDNIRKNLDQLKDRSDVQAQMQVHREALVKAIMERQPEQAREACHDHLAYIENVLLQLNREHSRIQRALRRTDKANA